MPTVCIQCGLRAMANGERQPIFTEEPDEHLRLHHPDPVATQREREELMKQLNAKYAATGGGDCPGCQRVMSLREKAEQGVCDDCAKGDRR